MPDHRRNRVPGGTFFFTLNLLDRRSNLLVTNIDALRDAVRRVRARAPFHINAWVVLPDHMHCLWTLPQDDGDFPGRWRATKTGFAKSLPFGEPRSPVMTRRGERGIWQQRYWEHTIRDDRDFAAHMDYTHFNPVKHGLVVHPTDWPHSSFPWASPAESIPPTGGAAASVGRNSAAPSASLRGHAYSSHLNRTTVNGEYSMPPQAGHEEPRDDRRDRFPVLR
jgi:putative transposase